MREGWGFCLDVLVTGMRERETCVSGLLRLFYSRIPPQAEHLSSLALLDDAAGICLNFTSLFSAGELEECHFNFPNFGVFII